jgi:hypothetical protein
MTLTRSEFGDETLADNGDRVAAKLLVKINDIVCEFSNGKLTKNRDTAAAELLVKKYIYYE